jgi:hypothetical protein
MPDGGIQYDASEDPLKDVETSDPHFVVCNSSSLCVNIIGTNNFKVFKPLD